jgi:FAD/FMN-containing dehydrogenase
MPRGVAAAVLVATTAAASAVSGRARSGDATCRCVPPDPCWDAVPWADLNSSVSGRLVAYSDELAPCLAPGGGVDSPACAAALDAASGFAHTSDNRWLESSPSGFQHTGYFGAWNASTAHFAFAVAAETEQDFQASVAFASTHNLRLVVKSTGHDWYGRSNAAGSLLLWTHVRKAMQWHGEGGEGPGFVPTGCSNATTAPVPAVTLESGVQFVDLYPEAQNRGRMVIGGTCDSVGVGGCWLAGCYGSLSKLYGAATMNVLEAKVVLANGSLVTLSQCSHPDLFWSLRGGGGGNIGVVTEYTARTHPAPDVMTSATFSGSVTTLEEYAPFMEVS